MDLAYVGLGSNLGDRVGNVASAVDAIAHFPSTQVRRISHAYETEPAYNRKQPAFVNAVIEVETGLEPEGMLMHLNQLEDSMGRLRGGPNEPRVIDLDLLLFGTEERQSENLTLPHPGLLERDFVVMPLLEIAPHVTLPDGTHPRRSKTTVGGVIRDLGPLPDAGMAHNVPVQETKWVSVAETQGSQSAIGGFDASVQFKRQVLQQEGIPYAFEPFEPGIDVDFLGRPRTFRLVVPVQYEERVEELFQELAGTAPMEQPVEAAVGDQQSAEETEGEARRR